MELPRRFLIDILIYLMLPIFKIGIAFINFFLLWLYSPLFNFKANMS